MIGEDLQESIYEYLKNNSSIASNRLVKRKDSLGRCRNDLIPARYLDDNQSELFKRFPFNHEISRSTFLKYLNVSLLKTSHQILTPQEGLLI